MTRAGALVLVVATLVAATAVDAAAARKKTHFGVFGKINGKNFKAPVADKTNDSCVKAIYTPSLASLVLTAGECRGKRHRVPRRNPKQVVLTCGSFESSVPIPPFDAPCPGSGYSEIRTGRFGAIKSLSQWTASLQLEGTTVTSPLNVHIDSFDGGHVVGSFSGVFDTPLPGATSPTVATDGAVQFDIPVTVE
jgi:hypothetical protein